MNNPITIAIDAMGGDNSPDKIIHGVSLHSKSSKNVNYIIFGIKELIKPLIEKYELSKERFDLVNKDNVVIGEDTALSAAKRGKETSLWAAIESLKNNNAHAIVSAGNQN